MVPYQYQQTQQQPERFYNKVDNQLKLNRRLLKNFNRAGKTMVRTEQLFAEGFNPNFIFSLLEKHKGRCLSVRVRIRLYKKNRE